MRSGRRRPRDPTVQHHPGRIPTFPIDGERRIAQNFAGHCATVANRLADRARAFAASTSRFLGGAAETRSSSRCCVACAISSTARLNTASLALEGFDTPAIFRTYCKAASCTSALVAAGSKLFKGLMFRHIHPFYCAPLAPGAPVVVALHSSDVRGPNTRLI